MGVVEDYLNLTAQWKKEYGEKTLVLMQVGSFFEVYGLREENGVIQGSNILEFSSICDMLVSPKSQQISKKQVMMAGFGVAQVDKYVKKLQDAGYTVVIYTQDIQSKNTTRSLSEIISPGTFFSTDNNQLTNNVVCVWLNKINKNKYTPSKMIIGVACINNLTGKSSIIQFEKEYHKDSSTYDDLERQISVCSPYECIMISNMDYDAIQEVIEFVSLSETKTHKISLIGKEAGKEAGKDIKSSSTLYKNAKNAEKQIYQQEILSRFFPNISSEVVAETFRSHEIANQAFVFLLDFIYQHSPNLVSKLSYPIFENHTDKLLLANHSLKQLNILDDDRHSGKLRSVSTFLNNCVTSMGKRHFLYNLHTPITNINELNTIYDITEYFINNKLWNICRENFNGIKDIDKFIRRLVFKKITPKDIIGLYNDLTKVVETFDVMYKDEYVNNHLSRLGLSETRDFCLMFKDLIENNFDLEKSSKIDDMSCDRLSLMSPIDVCFVNSGISANIDDLVVASSESTDKLISIQNYLSTLIQTVEKSTKQNLYIKIHETPKQEPMLIGTKRRISILQNCIEKSKNAVATIHFKTVNGTDDIFELNLKDLQFTTIGSNKKDLIVTNKQISTIAKNIQQSRDNLITEITNYFYNFIDNILGYMDKLEYISRFIQWADVTQNRCYIATKYNYCKPVIKDKASKAFIEFKELRHPLIEQLQTKELYVANDLELGLNKNGLLLYGTNAVGKTSFIRSIGISIVMAQAGLFVPAKEFIFKPYTKIFTRILGNDNLFKGLSTFAVEMSELRTILNMADENSLILGDELCSGTESDSARSIFTAGIEWLYKLNSTFMFATHFHEITDYEEMNAVSDKVFMMHMEVVYDKANDILIYDRKLKMGPGDNMYGLEVCKSLNLPNEFLSRAHSIRMKYDPKSKNILDEKQSHFNSKQIKGLCEICGEKRGTEVHHLKHQNTANTNNFIDHHHKNHKANLINICDACHDKIHRENIQHKKVKTTKGYKLAQIK
jgi:DNA mismatch repair protein MutS